MKMLATSYGCDMNIPCKIEGYAGECMFTIDGFYRRMYPDNPWSKMSYIFVDNTEAIHE